MAAAVFLLILCIVPVHMQRRNASPSVAIVLPPGLQSTKSNVLSVAVSENAQVHIEVSDASISLMRRTFEVMGGRPSNLTIGPFSSSPLSYLVRVDVKKSPRERIFYTQTFHLPRVCETSQAYLEMEKSFYRPMEMVRFRILPLGSDYRISSAPITALIQNPDTLIVWRETLTASDGKPFVKSFFQLPQHLADGQWKLLVRDASTNTQLAEKTFQVMRYDLPVFEVLVLSNASYFATGKESIEVLVLARLATGRSVSGILILSCSSTVLSNALITRSEIQDGNTTVKFNLQSCWLPSGNIPMDITIQADVRDFGSGERHFSTVRLPIRMRPHNLKLLPLKPGLTSGRIDSALTANTPILISIGQPNGQPAEGIPVVGSVDCVQHRNRMEHIHKNYTFGSTNVNGELLINLSLRQKCIALMIQISTNDPKLPDHQQDSQRLILPLFIADAVSLLEMDKFQYQVGETMAIRIQRIGSIGADIALRMLVISQSTVLAHFPITTDVIRFPVISEMLPEIAVILYHASMNSSTVIVDDIVRILVSFGCKRDKTILRLEDPNQASIRVSTFQPGSRATLFLQSTQGAFVGTKAIDKKLEQLARQFQITDRNTVAIPRKGDIFENLFNENKTMDGFDLISKKDNAVTMCCAAGRVWWQLNEDCADLKTELPYLKDCHQEFVTCCSNRDLPVSDPSCQSGKECRRPISVAIAGHFKSRMHHPRTFFATNPPPIPLPEVTSELIRRHFPEVWMFDEYNLGEEASLSIPITLPHSVTNWTLTGRFWVPNSPVCQVQTDIGIDMNAYMEIDLPSSVYVGDQMLTKVIIHNFETGPKKVTLNATKPAGVCTSKSSSVDWITLNASSTTVLTIPFEFMRNDRYEIVFTLIESQGHSRPRQLDQVVKEVYAMARETIDSSLEYNFSWDLGAGDGVNKWMNDTVMSYNFVRFRDEDASEINASIYLTDAVMSNLKINKVIAQFTPLPAAKRARWSKLKLANDTWRDFVMASSLNELLIKAPSVLQAVEDSKENDQNIPNALLMQSNQFLHLCQMETLSFRAHSGAYSPFRIKEPEVANGVPVSIWLTALATSLHCRTHMDVTVVCPSLTWLTKQQNGDGSFTASDSADFTTLTNQTDNAVMLTSFTLLTMRVCANYGNKCSTDDSEKRTAVRKALGYLANVDSKKSDALVVAAVAMTFAAWKYPFARPENDALLKLLEEGSDYPYWTYRRATNGWWDKVKHGAKGWFSTEYRNQMLSCQISLNAMGLMTQLLLGNPKRLNLEQIGLWLIEHRRRDGTFIRLLDTALASRAIHELQRSMVERDQNIVTRISVQCETSGGCPSLDITPQNAELTQSLNLNIDSRGITFLVTGRGAVYVKFQLIGSPLVRNSNYYPVQLVANTSVDGPNTYGHDLCFMSSDEAISTISIEHAFGSGLSYVPGTFSMTKGNATSYPPEPTSHSVHILFTDVKKKVDYCYTYQTKKAQSSAMFSLRRPILARHPSLGIVGMTLSAGQNQGSQIPLLEKYCPKNSNGCICAEAACPPPQTECTRDMCTDQHRKKLMKALCNSDNTGCVVKVIGQEEENTGRTVYKRFITSKHFALSPNSTDEECKDLDVLVGSTCTCPHLLRNNYYVLVVRRDALLEPNVKGFRPTVLAGEHGFFEPFFACSPDRQSDIHQLVQEDRRRVICANHTLTL